MDTPAPGRALHLRIGGRVQGVGFRPFVYRTALRLGIAGWVSNEGGSVTVHAQGEAAALGRFCQALVDEAPPLAQPIIESRAATAAEPLPGFTIRASTGVGQVAFGAIPADYCMCDACLAEIRDPAARRYRYPFTHCTQCGPRYTLTRALPYDRANSAMADFALCPACRAEYEDPADRRFHAQPLACPTCGPRLRFQQADRVLPGNAAALAACGGASAARTNRWQCSFLSPAQTDSSASGSILIQARPRRSGSAPPSGPSCCAPGGHTVASRPR